MIEIRKLTKYSGELAEAVRGLLIELSRSGKDKGEIPREWFEEIINSNSHEMLIAYDGEKVIGIATLSIIMGPGIGKNIYLEDFVVAAQARGQGVGNKLWGAMLDWGKEQGAKRLEFTCGLGREAAQKFYESHGAEKYDTNFYRLELV